MLSAFKRNGIRAAVISIFICTFVVTAFAAHSHNEAAAVVNALDLYWISFGGNSDSDPVYLMQIDQMGRVTKTPTRVLFAKQFGSDQGATALAKNGPGKVNLWVIGGFKILYRAIVNTSPVATVGFTSTGLIASDNYGLQATQKSTANFLAVEEGASVLIGEAFGSAGLLTGTKWILSPGAPNFNDTGSVSADGLAATTNRFGTSTGEKLYFQKLTIAGKPTVSPVLMASNVNIGSNDVTSALSNGRRYVAYVVINLANKLYLQIVNSNGGKVGSPILINTPPGRDRQSQVIALDPLGRFVVFTITGKNYGCTNHDVLVYQALDATGHTSGSLKLLAKCGLVGDDIENIDILKQ